MQGSTSAPTEFYGLGPDFKKERDRDVSSSLRRAAILRKAKQLSKCETFTELNGMQTTQDSRAAQEKSGRRVWIEDRGSSTATVGGSSSWKDTKARKKKRWE